MLSNIVLSDEQSAFCKSMTFLFWWKKPFELVMRPERTLAGVMDRGGIIEWRDMERLFPPEFIVHVLETAKCGEFHGWSWKFWRLRYGLDADVPLPARMPGLPAPGGEYWFEKLQRCSIAKNEENKRFKWTFAVRGMDEPDDV